MNKLTKLARITVAIAALILIATYFVPVWKIQLWAPQYPEGLTMKIWLSDLSGDVKVINGLNHYIGMKNIEKEMFPEFTWLPIIIAVYILLGLAVSLFNRFRGLVIYAALLFIGAVIAMTDFYWWGYDYGHNLNPEAAIVVPGMAYQPPLLGYKVLLNFTALSIPDTGGWIITLSGILVFAALFYELYVSRKRRTLSAKSATAVILVLGSISLFSFSACDVQPRPINFGKDYCSFCKMTLTDKRFGAEAVTKKGKIFVFDDLHCIAEWVKADKAKYDDVAMWLTVDFTQNGKLIDATKAMYLESPQLKSPMGSNTASFEHQADFDKEKIATNGEPTSWSKIMKLRQLK